MTSSAFIRPAKGLEGIVIHSRNTVLPSIASWIPTENKGTETDPFDLDIEDYRSQTAVAENTSPTAPFIYYVC